MQHYLFKLLFVSDIMLIGDINKFDFKLMLLPKVIQDALLYLKKTDFSSFENKRYPIKGREVFVILNEYKTKPKSRVKAECHRKYVDIHFIISGKERMGVGFKNRGNKLFKRYSDREDVSLYSHLEKEADLILSQGMYVILFPEDIHRPGCNLNGEGIVRKAVVKIALRAVK